MEQNTDRMGFALIALSVVAFVLLIMNTIFLPTIRSYFQGLQKWSDNAMNQLNPQQQYEHTAYANIVSLCKENSNFKLSEASLVRYGSDSRWVYKELQAGAYTATNTFFGSDPVNGTQKNVELVSDFSTVYPNLNLFTGTSDKPSTKTGSSWNVAIIGVNKTPKVGQEYTISVEVPEADHDALLEVFRWDDAGHRVGESLSYTRIKSGSKVHITFTWPDPKDSGAIQFAANLAWTNGTDTGTYSYDKVKLEEGSTVTPYMPSASELKPSDQPKYIGTYTDKNETASQDVSKYTWKLNPDYHE